MATLASFNQDQEKDQQPNTGGGGQVLNSTAPGAAPVGGGGVGAPQGTPQQSTPSGRPNIQQYMQANQGAGQQLAGGIQRNTQAQTNQFNQQFNTAQDTLNQQYNPIAQGLGSGEQVAQTAFQNPQALLDAYSQQRNQQQGLQNNNQPDQQNVNQFNQFQKLRSGGYGSDIGNYQAAGQQAQANLQPGQQNIQQQADLSKNEMGRFQLLRKTIGQPNYSTGQQNLDALFLQAQPGVARNLQQNLGGMANQASQKMNQLGSDVQKNIQDLSQQSGNVQNYIKNLFTKGQGAAPGLAGLNQIQENVQQRYQNLAQTAPQQQQHLGQAVKDIRTLSDQDLAALGLNRGMATWGADLSPFLKNNALLAAEQGGYAQAASPEEFARFNALNRLAGGGDADLQQNIFGTAQQAGGYNPVTFDRAGFEKEVANKQNTVLNTDFQNAIANSFGTMIGSKSGGGTSMGHTPDWHNPLAPVWQNIQNQVKNNGWNPEQVYQHLNQQVDQLIAAQNPAFVDAGTKSRLMAQFDPFLKYYGDEYGTARNAILGENGPDQNPLPSKGQGQIDWSKIKAPQGK